MRAFQTMFLDLFIEPSNDLSVPSRVLQTMELKKI